MAHTSCRSPRKLSFSILYLLSTKEPTKFVGSLVDNKYRVEKLNLRGERII